MLCLVVDDSKSARFTISRSLKKLGYDVLTAESGEDALELLCAETPDVVFMDHLMPGLDGFETSKKIRSQSNFANLPIIMCTARDSDDYSVQAKRIGLSGTLPKPASDESILKILESLNLTQTGSHTARDNTVSEIQTQEQVPAPSVAPPPVKTEQPTVAPPETKTNEIELNDQLRTLIRAEAEGRARDSAQRLLTDSWGRFRGNLQEDVRQQTRDMFDRHIENSLDTITSEVRNSIGSSLTSELRHYVDKKLSTSETSLQISQNDFTVKLNGLKRQLDLQKFDPVALQETILEDARRAAEYTATHKAVDTASKITKELCEETISEILDTSILEHFETQLVQMNEQLELQTQKSGTLTMVATFASVLALLSFVVAVWALL